MQYPVALHSVCIEIWPQSYKEKEYVCYFPVHTENGKKLH